MTANKQQATVERGIELTYNLFVALYKRLDDDKNEEALILVIE